MQGIVGYEGRVKMSHPSRVRGLKYTSYTRNRRVGLVAPFTGAWIEIAVLTVKSAILLRRTLHGCVD